MLPAEGLLMCWGVTVNSMMLALGKKSNAASSNGLLMYVVQKVDGTEMFDLGKPSSCFRTITRKSPSIVRYGAWLEGDAYDAAPVPGKATTRWGSDMSSESLWSAALWMGRK